EEPPAGRRGCETPIWPPPDPENRREPQWPHPTPNIFRHTPRAVASRKTDSACTTVSWQTVRGSHRSINDAREAIAKADKALARRLSQHPAQTFFWQQRP